MLTQLSTRTTATACYCYCLRVGQEAFAMVPFIDMANHSVEPNADFRTNTQDGSFELFTMREVRAGEEVLISYTGREGYTNQRLMAQYGFVIPGGNPADRLELAGGVGR